MFSRGVVISGLFWLVGACGGSSDVCDGAALTSALASAAPGTTVTVGACTVQGKFTIPAGVTLQGLGPTMSTVSSTGTALIIGGDGVTVANLAIQNGTGHGIVAVSHDHVTVHDVTITSALGRASLGFQDVPNLTLTRVTATGPVTVANATVVPDPPSETTTALYGIVLERVGAATLDTVTLNGFGAGGFAADASTTTWTNGTVNGNLGLGVWLSGGAATFSHLTISGTLRGFRLTPTFGLAAGGGAMVHTMDCTIADTQGGFGVFHDGGAGIHERLVASNHAAGAILAQHVSSLAVSGAMLTDNDFAGIIAVESSGVSVTDTTVMTTHASLRMLPGWGSVMVGDGIQLVRPMTGTMLSGVTLMSNDRAGLLIDAGGGDASGLTIASADVTATGTQFGCVMQDGHPLAGWDAAVTRHGAAVTNDVTFTGGLDVAGIIGPVDIPQAMSLSGIIGPVD